MNRAVSIVSIVSYCKNYWDRFDFTAIDNSINFD